MEYIGVDLVLGILFGLWCKHLAGSKGYNELIGFIVGFFIGILGVIIYFVIPSQFLKNKNINIIAVQPKQNQTNDSTNMVFCPHCYNKVEVLKEFSTHKCPYCGKVFVI